MYLAKRQGLQIVIDQGVKPKNINKKYAQIAGAGDYQRKSHFLENIQCYFEYSPIDSCTECAF